MQRENVRLARVDDSTIVSEIVKHAYTPWIPIVGRRPRPMDDNYDERCAKGHVWLLELDRKPVGVVIEDIDGSLFLHNVAVCPEAQHRGFGRLLMRFVEDEARRRGFNEVKLTTSVVMQRNVDLYRSLGYVVKGAEPTATVDRLLMAKCLDTAADDGGIQA